MKCARMEAAFDDAQARPELVEGRRFRGPSPRRTGATSGRARGRGPEGPHLRLQERAPRTQDRAPGTKEKSRAEGAANVAFEKLVGMARFELAIPRPPGECDTRLRYIPKRTAI